MSVPSMRTPRNRKSADMLDDMRGLLLRRLDALRSAYAPRWPALAGMVGGAIARLDAGEDPKRIGIELGRAIESSCITAAARRAEGLFVLAYSFGSLGDGIRERAGRRWLLGCREQAATAAREMERALT